MAIKRNVLNPILTISGGLTVISGLLLLFHLKSWAIVAVHELGSLIFLVCCILHLAVNWRPLLSSLKGRTAAWLVIGSLVLGGLGLTYSGLTADPGQMKRGHRYSTMSSR